MIFLSCVIALVLSFVAFAHVYVCVHQFVCVFEKFRKSQPYGARQLAAVKVQPEPLHCASATMSSCLLANFHTTFSLLLA